MKKGKILAFMLLVVLVAVIGFTYRDRLSEF
jgi:hypothetical protein